MQWTWTHIPSFNGGKATGQNDPPQFSVRAVTPRAVHWGAAIHHSLRPHQFPALPAFNVPRLYPPALAVPFTRYDGNDLGRS